MVRQNRRLIAITAAAVLLMTTAACAAKTARDRARVTGVTITEALKALDAAEVDVAGAGIPQYTAAARESVSDAIYAVSVGVAAYNEAVKGWLPESATAPEQIAAARLHLTAAIAELKRAIPAVDVIRQPLLRALNAIEAALAEPIASTATVLPVQAQLPAAPMLVFNLLALIFRRWNEGKLDVERIIDFARRENVSDEELDAAIADAQAIADRRDPSKRSPA